MKLTQLKPCPEMTLRAHLLRLQSYCEEMSLQDKSPKRKQAFQNMQRQLDTLLKSRALSALHYYGE